MALRLAVGSLLVAASDALVLGTRACGVVRAPSACADLSAFEKSFMDQADIVDYLDKNRALCELKEAMPSLLSKGDGAELRRGIDKAREAGASVAELKKFVEGLKKVDPDLVTATDEAILLGAEQVVIASAPKPATKPPDSYLTDEQFHGLRIFRFLLCCGQHFFFFLLLLFRWLRVFRFLFRGQRFFFHILFRKLCFFYLLLLRG